MNIIAEMWAFAEAASHNKNAERLWPLNKAFIFVPMENDTDFGYIAEYEDKIVICFRGTGGSLKAWISNFDPYPLRKDRLKQYWFNKLKHTVTQDKGRIHDGFYTAWDYFKKEIKNFLITREFTQKKIICTGHSRGGALATLCARHIAKNLKIPCSCVSFGAPAQGTKAYREEFDNLPVNMTRTEHGYDIVPELPPHAFGFRHVGKKLWLREPRWHKWLPWMRIKDHYYSTYTKGLIKYCKKKGDCEGEMAMRKVLKRTTI